MNILFPLFTIVLVYISLVAIYYRTEEKTRRWITSVFGKYVSPIVAIVMQPHDDDIPQTEKIDLSVDESVKIINAIPAVEVPNGSILGEF